MPYIAKSLGLMIAYLASAKVGLMFGTVSSSATLFWPPEGIALAALLLGGVIYLPAIIIAASLTALMVDAHPVFALGYTFGNVLQAYLGYFMLRRLEHFDPTLGRVRDLYLIILLGAFIAPLVDVFVSPMALLAAGMLTTDILPDAMWQWWRADALGISLFTPAILVFAKQKSRFFKQGMGHELAALWGASFLIGQSVFLGWKLPGITLEQPADSFWIFPLLIWAGLRTGRRNTALIQTMFMAQILAGAYLEVGYFSDDFVRYGMANFWVFGMVLCVGGMALAIQSTSQRRTAHLIERNAKVFGVSNDGIMITDADNNIVEVNPAFTKLTGYTHEEALGKNPRFLGSGNQDPQFFAEMWRALTEHGHWEGELWNRRKDGVAFLEKLFIYTLKDAHGKVINRVGIFSDITKHKAELNTASHHAQHDFLTNLPNRMLFHDRFNQQLAQAKRYPKKFAVMYIDLDKFKPVNDTLGHQVGDQLLMAVADRLKLLVREIDTVSRFGGDEFAILMSEVMTKKDVTSMAEKILTALSQPFILGRHTVNISASLGIAIYPDDGSDMETILSKADSAMYQAKHEGSNIYKKSDTSA